MKQHGTGRNQIADQRLGELVDVGVLGG